MFNNPLKPPSQYPMTVHMDIEQCESPEISPEITGSSQFASQSAILDSAMSTAYKSGRMPSRQSILLLKSFLTSSEAGPTWQKMCSWDLRVPQSAQCAAKGYQQSGSAVHLLCGAQPGPRPAFPSLGAWQFAENSQKLFSINSTIASFVSPTITAQKAYNCSPATSGGSWCNL